MVRAAILDDYQNVAMGFADWSPIAKNVEIKVFNKPFGSQDEAIKALQGFAVVVGMRERTPFPRKVIEALPDLKLLITTGARNNSFDVKACAERGITVCGTGAVGSPTTGIAFGLMLELTRRIGFENRAAVHRPTRSSTSRRTTATSSSRLRRAGDLRRAHGEGQPLGALRRQRAAITPSRPSTCGSNTFSNILWIKSAGVIGTHKHRGTVAMVCASRAARAISSTTGWPATGDFIYETPGPGAHAGDRSIRRA